VGRHDDRDVGDRVGRILRERQRQCGDRPARVYDGGVDAHHSGAIPARGERGLAGARVVLGVAAVGLQDEIAAVDVGILPVPEQLVGTGGEGGGRGGGVRLPLYT